MEKSTLNSSKVLIRRKAWETWKTLCTVVHDLLEILFENFPEHADDFLERPRSLLREMVPGSCSFVTSR